MKLKHPLSWQWFIPAAFIIGSPSFAHAHPAGSEVNGLVSGLAHPLGGIDHLCAMIGVGLWAAQRGGRAVWLLPLAFMAVMAFGGLLGMVAVSIPFVESGIVASILILGILIAAAVRLPLLLSVLMVGAFALFHGHAHGAEMPHTVSGMMYGIGFLMATGILLNAGVGIGLVVRRSGSLWLLRCSGAALILCSIYLLLPT